MKSGARPTPMSAPSSQRSWCRGLDARRPQEIAKAHARPPRRADGALLPRTPATGGSKNARPFPAHSSVTTIVVDGARRMSASVNVSGVSTSPSTTSLHAASSMDGAGRTSRREQLVRVIQESSRCGGVSRSWASRANDQARLRELLLAEQVPARQQGDRRSSNTGTPDQIQKRAARLIFMSECPSHPAD